jgi:hypothetical protein
LCEPTIPTFERAKTVHALDRAATAIGSEHLQNVTTNDYVSLTELQTEKIAVTKAHIKSSQFVMSDDESQQCPLLPC